MKYKYLFGPVPSRRLGMSLGIDLVPKKVCSLNCVYCEVGRTTGLTAERKEYVLFDKVIAELDHYFKNNPDPDYLTFSGSGEPTLNSRLGDVIVYLKKMRPDIPIAVLTNGTLLSDKKMRDELMGADVVLPSLDAATEAVFQKINRPVSGLSIDTVIDGLVEFGKSFKGKIWLEVFILPGYNYDENEILEIGKAIKRINPDSVQLNTLDRPGAEDNLISASRDELEKVMELLEIDNVEIIAALNKKRKAVSFRKDIENAILGTISRRPCTVDDLSEILDMPIVEVNKYIRILETENRIESVQLERGAFFQVVDL